MAMFKQRWVSSSFPMLLCKFKWGRKERLGWNQSVGIYKDPAVTM